MVVTHSGKEHIIDFSLDNLMSQLDPKVFYSANKQYIVGIDSIRKVENYKYGQAIICIEPSHNNTIIVRRDRVSEFREWLNQYISLDT